MTSYLLLFVGTMLVNNFVLVKFLGLCPFMGVSKKLESAIGMGLATTPDGAIPGGTAPDGTAPEVGCRTAASAGASGEGS